MLEDLLAIVLGTLFSIRRLEIKRTVLQPRQDADGAKEAEDSVRAPSSAEAREGVGSLSGVDPVQLERWRAAALRAETLGMVACLIKVLASFAFRTLAPAALSPTLLRAGGAGLFFAWLASMVVAFAWRRRARALAPELPPGVSPAGPRAEA